MTDIHLPEVRKRNMAAVKSRNTGIELIVRRSLHKAGFRYRLHVKGMPGTPDIVLKSYKAVIFINGCFWHGHSCELFNLPKTHKEFWEQKITRNKANDTKNISLLRSAGWRIAILWGCLFKGKRRVPIEALTEQLITWLKSEQAGFEPDSEMFLRLKQ